MIYILGKIDNLNRKSREASLLDIFKTAGQPAQLILSTEEGNWEKYKKYGIQKHQVYSIYELFCNRHMEEARTYGLNTIKLDPTWTLVKRNGKTVIYIDQENKKRAEIVFYDSYKSLIKEVLYVEEKLAYEYDDRGFIKSIRENISENQFVRVYLDNTNSPSMKCFYENNLLTKIELIKEELSFDSGQEFAAWFYSQWLSKAEKSDVFLLLQVRELFSLLPKKFGRKNLFLLPDFSIEEAATVGISNKVFEFKEITGMVFETEIETEKYQNHFGLKKPFQFGKTFTTETRENERFQHTEKNIYVNFGNIDEARLEKQLEWLLFFGQKNGYRFSIEVYGGKRTMKVRQFIMQNNAEKVFELLSRPYRKTLKEKMKSASMYILLDEKIRISESFIEAVSNKIPVVLPPGSYYSKEINNHKTGLIAAQENIGKAIKTLEKNSETIENNWKNYDLISNKYGKKQVVKRWLEILNDKNR